MATTAPQQRTATAARSSSASPLPLILGVLSVLLGALSLLFLQGGLWTTVLVGIEGYLLSGFVPVIMLGWDVSAQRRGSKDPNFRPRRKFSLGLRIVVIVGFVVAIVHLLGVADSLALVLSEWLYVMGWVSP